MNATVRRCFSCRSHIDGRSAADYVDGKLQPFHPGCLVTRKSAARAPKKSTRAYYDWRYRSRARQLLALAVGLRRLKRTRSSVVLLRRAEQEADELGLSINFRSGAR